MGEARGEECAHRRLHFLIRAAPAAQGEVGGVVGSVDERGKALDGQGAVGGGGWLDVQTAVFPHKFPVTFIPWADGVVDGGGETAVAHLLPAHLGHVQHPPPSARDSSTPC